ncbi:MAG: phytanoyl-CoA dioxygenase family protein [Methylovulum sp.]|nr:phytanoyl-CoA dioxygenase family protein [Methylovulum sp.]
MSTTISHYAEQIERDGYAIVDNVLDPDLLETLDNDIRRLEALLSIPLGKNDFEGTRTLRIHNLLTHGELYQAIPVHPKILPIIEHILDPGCLISSMSTSTLLPGETAQAIHADDQLIPLPKPHIPIILNTLWAISDFTEANGATRIIPGSHKQDHNPAWDGHYDSIPAQMPKGSVLILHGSVWHGGGANHSQQRRAAIALNYCAGYIRQQENQQLGIPKHIARGFSKRLSELVGYSIYNTLIGHINCDHPGKLLDQ